MKIFNDYNIGEVVFLKTDKEQSERIVVMIQVFGPNDISYELRCGTSSSIHFGCEITREKDILLTLTN